jgi:hypothetical protein
MEESSTYRAILARGIAKGQLQGASRFLLRQGRIKFGEPDAATVANIRNIADLEKLHGMAVRLLHVRSWQDLFANESAPL